MKPPDANELLRQEGVDALRAAIDGAPAQRVVSIESARKPKRKTSPSRASWLKGAVEDDRGRVLPILANVALALRTAPELREAAWPKPRGGYEATFLDNAIGINVLPELTEDDLIPDP